MQELCCVDCGRRLMSGVETFGAVGCEQCQLCYLESLERLNDIDEADEYTQLFQLETQSEATALYVTLHGQSTQLLF